MFFLLLVFFFHFVVFVLVDVCRMVVVVVSVDPASQWRTGDPSLKNPREFS